MKLTDPRLHYKTDAEMFDYFAPQNGPDFDSTKRLRQSVLARLSNARGFFLDAGSGDGWLINAKPHVRFISIDLGMKNLLSLRKKHPHAMLVCADVTRLPFREGSLDGVVASEVMEHLNEPEAAAREFARVCKSGASIVLSTPYKETLRYYLCIHCNKPTPANAHIQTFDENRHRQILDGVGFSDIRYAITQNKLFIGLRLSHALRFLPYRIWAVIDQLFMFAYRKAHTIIVTGTKPSAGKLS